MVVPPHPPLFDVSTNNVLLTFNPSLMSLCIEHRLQCLQRGVGVAALELNSDIPVRNMTHSNCCGVAT